MHHRTYSRAKPQPPRWLCPRREDADPESRVCAPQRAHIKAGHRAAGHRADESARRTLHATFIFSRPAPRTVPPDEREATRGYNTTLVALALGTRVASGARRLLDGEDTTPCWPLCQHGLTRPRLTAAHAHVNGPNPIYCMPEPDMLSEKPPCKAHPLQPSRSSAFPPSDHVCCTPFLLAAAYCSGTRYVHRVEDSSTRASGTLHHMPVT
jgi:hypothetical protein